jgi:hypothetical protein
MGILFQDQLANECRSRNDLSHRVNTPLNFFFDKIERLPFFKRNKANGMPFDRFQGLADKTA